MLIAIAWIFPIAEAANESGCQAPSKYGLLAGYSPTTNISDLALIDQDVRNLGTESNSTVALSIYETGGNYSLRALSIRAKALMFDCAVGCPLKHYQMYIDYYGDYDYADKWVRGAILQKPTAYSEEKGDADFSFDTFDPANLNSNSNNLGSSNTSTPWQWADLREAASQGATFLTTWMWSIGMFEEAVNLCSAADTNAALGYWDKGVAYYTGSLEGGDGNSKIGTYGELTYAYAERRCVQFKTCGVVGGGISGGSRVNFELATLFYDGQRFLKAKQCSPLRALTYKIVQLMSVPLVQSTLRSAYRVGFNQLGAAEVNAGRAEAAACAAALLPLLYYCDSSSGRNAAEIVANQMELGSASVDFTKVKNAVEQSYQCLGITCIEVGGLWDAGNGSGAYRNSASPCVDSQQSQTYIEVYTPIAGYSPGGNVVEHNEIDLDQKAMEDAIELSQVGSWYATGGNSQRSGGKLRTIADFSLTAQKKMYGGCQKKPCDNQTCVSPTNIELDPNYVGSQCYTIYKKYYNYYGSFTYADKWVTSAVEGTVFLEGGTVTNRLADFSQASDAVRKAAAVTGSAFMATWMYAIREFEDGVDDCQTCEDIVRGCNDNSADASINAWDEGVAFAIGSLEGTQGNSRKVGTNRRLEGDEPELPGTGPLYEYGVGFYALAERRCIDFKTCGLFGSKLTGGSQVNHGLLTVHMQGNLRLRRSECAAMRPIVDEIIQLMTVPLIQSTMLFAYKRETEGNTVYEDVGHGVAFAAAMLPLLHDCDIASGAKTAETLFENMKLGAISTSFSEVKSALEANYDCLGILCSSVGGIWDAAAGQYFRGAYPCGNYPPMCKDALLDANGNSTGAPICLTCGPAAYYSVGEAYCSPCPPGTNKNETNEATSCDKPCATEPTIFTVSTSCVNMKRSVAYSFVHKTNCPASWLTEDLQIDCEYLQEDQPAVYAMYGLAILAMIVYLLMLAAIIWYRHERAVRFAQPLFLYMLAVGGVVSLLPIFLLPGPPSYVQCFVPRAVVMLGFTLTFGCLLLKTYRVYKIHEAAQGLRMLKITNNQMMTKLVVLLLVDVIVLLLWGLVAFPKPAEELVYMAEVGGNVSNQVCSSDAVGDAFIAGVYILKSILTLAMCYMAFKTRTLSVDYSESKWIFISSHELLVCAVIILPLMHILPDESRIFSYLLQCICLLLVSSVCVSLSLAPKIRLAYKGTTAGEETKEGRFGSALSNSDNSDKNTSDGNSIASVALANKKMQQVRALAMFGQQGDGDELSTNAFSVREAKMLEALRSLTMDNALLEERNAELLHISKLARQARGKRQALDPAIQVRLEALAQPVALSHLVGLEDKKGTSKPNIKDQASKRASGGSGSRAGVTTPPLFTEHSSREARNTDSSASSSPRHSDMSFLPELAEEQAAGKKERIQVVIDLAVPPDTRLRTSESLPPSPPVALDNLPDNLSERLIDSAAGITPGGKATPPPSSPASEPDHTPKYDSRSSSPPERLSKTPSKLSLSL